MATKVIEKAQLFLSDVRPCDASQLVYLVLLQGRLKQCWEQAPLGVAPNIICHVREGTQAHPFQDESPANSSRVMT